MPSFQLNELDVTAIERLVSHLGPGRIPLKLTNKAVDIYEASSDPQDVHFLGARATDFGRQ